jgi:hypothetical protein
MCQDGAPRAVICRRIAAGYRELAAQALHGLSGNGEAVPVRLTARARTMFTSIRKYNVRRGSAEELARRVQESFVPIIRHIQGFRGYYLLDGGPDVIAEVK